MNRLITLALTLPLSLAAVACADSQSSEPGTEQNVAKATAVQTEQAPAADPVVAGPELAALVQSIQPAKARNGSLRFSDEALVQPAAAPLLLARLQSGNESEAVRAALITALPQTQGDYAAEALTMLKAERSETLRVALVNSMRLANDSAAALEGLGQGMADSSTQVRIRAAFAIGRRADGLALTDTLVTALSDSDTELQATAARALGNLGAAAAFDKVAPLISSRDADVRLESLRALGRMDAGRAAALPQLATLAQDSDERIRTAAAKVAAKAY